LTAVTVPITGPLRVVFINRPPTEAEIKQRRLTQVTQKQWDRKVRPHAIVLGQLVLTWSRLHEELGRLFYAVVGAPDPGVPLAAWHSSRNDRAQREMLKGAAEAAFSASLFRPARTPNDNRALKDIEWLLNKCDGLSSKRDDAIHAPFSLQMPAGLTAKGFVRAGKAILRPEYTWGNKRALKLREQWSGDVSIYFGWTKEHIDNLTRFATALHNALLWPESFPWPDRPPLPPLGQLKNPKAKRSKTLPK
jgi:hypothetical protein